MSVTQICILATAALFVLYLVWVSNSEENKESEYMPTAITVSADSIVILWYEAVLNEPMRSTLLQKFAERDSTKHWILISGIPLPAQFIEQRPLSN